MASSALSRVLSLERLQRDDVAWRLLRADNAPVVVGLLGHHLGGDERRMSATDLYERIDADLEQLRDHGVDLPRTARAYCADWRESGFLVRRPAADARGEVFELSAGALDAIRALDAREEPGRAATESRLADIAAQLGRLAVDTDPDASSQLALLEARREALDARITAARAGEIDVLDDDRAFERVLHVLDQVAEMPGDFARIRAEFEALNRALREQILDADDSRATTVLDDVFRGVDMIADSPAGHSFAAFSALVLDPELGSSFDDSVDQVLGRPFARRLRVDQRRALRRFVVDLKRRAMEIQDVTARFARGLRQYVQSQEYQQDRVLRTLLRRTMAAGVEAASRIKPYRETRIRLDLTSVPMAGLGAVRLTDPAADRAPAEVAANEAGHVDLAALRALARETEIDFDELTRNVNAAFDACGPVTIAEVLRRTPATQGVASVVGLLSLADDHGATDEGTETVHWSGLDGVRRRADLPRIRFEEAIA